MNIMSLYEHSVNIYNYILFKHEEKMDFFVISSS